MMYSKQIRLPEIGAAGQEKLAHAKVLCVGAGGLGAPLITYLSSCGVGTIGIVDADTVELSNLHRQPLFNADDVGQPKVELLRKYLINRKMGTQVETHEFMLTRHNALEILESYDVIIDASDNFDTKYVLNDACYFLKKPFITASVAGFEGTCILFDFTKHPGEPCYRCLYPSAEVSNTGLNCDSLGVLGAVPGILGIIQAIECIKYIVGIEGVSHNKIVVFDAISMSLKSLHFNRDSSCRLCSGASMFGDLLPITATDRGLSSCAFAKALKIHGDKAILVDVRSREEYERYNIGGKLIPLPELDSAIRQFNKNDIILVNCEHGMRSKTACELFVSKGFEHVFYLKGDLVSLDPSKVNKNSC